MPFGCRSTTCRTSTVRGCNGNPGRAVTPRRACTQGATGYIPQLLAWADAAEAGTLKPYEREQWEQLQSQARAVPLRDLSGAYGGWGAKPDDPTAQRLLNVNSPDIGNFMLTVREKMKSGTATPQERALFQETARTAADWDFRASSPQESDANAFGLGQ